jgi:hypothetical protein
MVRGLLCIALCCTADALTLTSRGALVPSPQLRTRDFGPPCLAPVRMAAPDDDGTGNPESVVEPVDLSDKPSDEGSFWDFGGAEGAPPFYMALAPGAALLIGRFVLMPLLTGDQ